MFRAHVLIIRRSKLHYTASGIITPIGVMRPEAVKCNYHHTYSWLITEINIFKCTVSKTSKFDKFSHFLKIINDGFIYFAKICGLIILSFL